MILEILADALVDMAEKLQSNPSSGLIDGATHPSAVLVFTREGSLAYHDIAQLVYSETNPNFKAWFFDIVLQELSPHFEVSVVVVRKWGPALVKSLYQTGFFSVRDGYQWMETANSVNSRIPALAPDNELSALELIISYVIHTEALAGHISGLSKQYGVNLVETRSETLFSKGGAVEVFEKLGLHPSSSTPLTIGNVQDKYRDDQQKRRLTTINSRADSCSGGKGDKLCVAHITLEECVSAWDSYLQRASAEGQSIPPIIPKAEDFQYTA
eukprot:Plantae.Rhodophyta-Purpureofilum_apyrenoidigerum.ctg22006.p1 GENE.Plantae.Rhodophyta-Purpureofilum_apyrenoidigerum.ctg22006~~Plantae.Rhodophyta-Purpureofilum_apyrenoidigerum.ctg22006.p1  ORF type:complete len:270 (-),score=42.61 Plantae.Rhodophyta-Purpureofilum_apyrenoidigerum.ctg22006:590-1399(-)